MKRRSITLEELMRHYDVFNRSEGKSPATVYFYNEKLVAFVRFLESQGIDPLLDCASSAKAGQIGPIIKGRFPGLILASE